MVCFAAAKEDQYKYKGLAVPTDEIAKLKKEILAKYDYEGSAFYSTARLWDDGINEKGLCTSIMALPKMAAQQDTEKHDVGTTVIMRLFLDRCATVQEALDLVNSVDIRHDAVGGSGYHYMVADASGDCAVIEFDKEDGWKTMVVRKSPDFTYMHVTNHLLSEK